MSQITGFTGKLYTNLTHACANNFPNESVDDPNPLKIIHENNPVLDVTGYPVLEYNCSCTRILQKIMTQNIINETQLLLPVWLKTKTWYHSY